MEGPMTQHTKRQQRAGNIMANTKEGHRGPSDSLGFGTSPWLLGLPEPTSSTTRLAYEFWPMSLGRLVQWQHLFPDSHLEPYNKLRMAHINPTATPCSPKPMSHSFPSILDHSQGLLGNHHSSGPISG